MADMVRPALQSIAHQAAGPAMIVALACDILRGVVEQTLDQFVIYTQLVAQPCRHRVPGHMETAILKHTLVAMAQSADRVADAVEKDDGMLPPSFPDSKNRKVKIL